MKWESQPSGMMNGLRGVWGSDKDNMWAVSDNGTILKGNGTTWTLQSSGTKEPLNGVWGSDKGNVWAVGYNGTLLRYMP